MLTEVLEDSADDGLDWTDKGVATTGEPNDFTTDAVFLVGEGEGGEASLLDLFNRCIDEVDTGVSNEQLDVVQSKGVVVVVGVFARA